MRKNLQVFPADVFCFFHVIYRTTQFRPFPPPARVHNYLRNQPETETGAVVLALNLLGVRVQ